MNKFGSAAYRHQNVVSGLKAPKPIVIVGAFESDGEDPLSLESAVEASLRDSKAVKPWFDVAKHPGVYRAAANYSVEGEVVKVRLFLQAFDVSMSRKTLKTIELQGTRAGVTELAERIRSELEKGIAAVESSQPGIRTETNSVRNA